MTTYTAIVEIEVEADDEHEAMNTVHEKLGTSCCMRLPEATIKSCHWLSPPFLRKKLERLWEEAEEREDVAFEASERKAEARRTETIRNLLPPTNGTA
jgi:hypothetical protein